MVTAFEGSLERHRGLEVMGVFGNKYKSLRFENAHNLKRRDIITSKKF